MKFGSVLLLFAFTACATVARAATRTDLGFDVGADAGVGGAATLTFSDFASGLPFAVRVSAGYLALNPGDAPLARQVFVNEATNGTPEKRGHRWDMRLDARYQVKGGRLAGAWLCFGPRLSLYDGTFDFVGGNETFHVITHQPGVGFALEEQYPIGKRTNLAIGAGMDWFANADFTGHGATYSPDGTAVDPKEDFGYADADKAISQPRFAPRITVGLQTRLGR
jgi:hypothetical protein